jgi:hypothetical protein
VLECIPDRRAFISLERRLREAGRVLLNVTNIGEPRSGRCSVCRRMIPWYEYEVVDPPPPHFPANGGEDVA